MASLTKLPSPDSLTDKQFLQVEGPDGIITGFQYDKQQRALYTKESQVVYPGFHGRTHIAEDPIPVATCDTPGLMSSEDKCKLDAVLRTRLGVFGFQGAGFPDDGGWMQGDIILAPGTEFISIERIGNIIRFTVDSPVPLNCACESCSTIYWVQDETDVAAIRPPTCSGKMPGVNGYGELKVHIFPEATLFDPNSPATKLNQKGKYPSLIFKRYDDGITPGDAEFELVLKRDRNNLLQSEIGWAMTPGPLGVAEMVWFVGKDTEGNQLRFDLKSDPTPGLVGGLLYGGHLITKRMAVVTDYTADVLTTNHYTCRWWNILRKKPTGESFTATNIWAYHNPENPTSGAAAQTQALDIGLDLLPVGTLVDIWYFKVGEVAGTPILRHFFNRQPQLSPHSLWSQVGALQFGDQVELRYETSPDTGEEDKAASTWAVDRRNFERRVWGLSGFDEPLLTFDTADLADTAGSALNQQHRAVLDANLPGLRVLPADAVGTGNFSERPVTLWLRQELRNATLRADIGRPALVIDRFPPVDILLGAQVDSYDDIYLAAVGTGVLSGVNYVLVRGAHFHDLPPSGVVRIISPGPRFDRVFRYIRKVIFPTSGDFDTIALLSEYEDNLEFPGEAGDVLELLHEEYSGPILRIEFKSAGQSGQVSVQFKVGELSMSAVYEDEVTTDDIDDYVRGMAPGYTVSRVYTQASGFTGVGPPPSSVPAGFVVYDGGAQPGGQLAEYWNRLEVMIRDEQVWVWWNHILIPPSGPLSAVLGTPVQVGTPYFPLARFRPSGKVGLRLWPGASLRFVDVWAQARSFTEFAYGQLELGR